MKPNKNEESGFVLVGVLILLALAALIISGSLNFAATGSRTILASKERARNYYSSEESLNKALTWLRANSTGLALLFSRTNFYTNFQRTSPGVGLNDTGLSQVPTKIKLRGSSNNYSAILSNSSTLGTAAFPTTTDAATGAAFAPATVFSAASLGGGKVKVTLVDAVAITPSMDYGDPALGNAQPATDFNPVYRIDAMDSLNDGAHVLGYVTGALALDYGVGFYGRDSFTMNQGCDSYISNSGTYSSSSKRANCTTGSNGTLAIHQVEKVYGSVRTNGTISSSSPWGGKVCSDFISGCPNLGSSCQGNTCAVPGLPSYSTWSTYCPTNQGNLSINSSTTLNVPGNNANQKCWGTITLGNNKVLTLQSTNYSYYIDTLDIPNTGRINFDPQPATGTINLYVKKFVGDKFNGNQVFNTNNKPYQLKIHYLGNTALTMNGTAAMKAFLVSPYASVTVSGNFDYSGGIKATALSFSGSGTIHYDESGGITTISDTTYRLRDVEEKYR